MKYTPTTIALTILFAATLYHTPCTAFAGEPSTLEPSPRHEDKLAAAREKARQDAEKEYQRQLAQVQRDADAHKEAAEKHELERMERLKHEQAMKQAEKVSSPRKESVYKTTGSHYIRSKK